MKSRSMIKPGILIALVALNAAAVTRYVDLNSPSPTPPYTNWLTAATNIQDAVDAAVAGDTVLVTNGVYADGGRVVQPYLLTNRVVVDKAIVLQSLNGAEVTVIQGNPVPGDSAIRCVYLANGASLTGFTLTNGATRNTPGDNLTFDWSGGGVFCGILFSATVSNCVFISNSAAYYGGGVRGCIVNNCVLTGNAAAYGGGAGFSKLNHCWLSGNVAGFTGGSGGGTASCYLDNCVLTRNSAIGAGGGADSSQIVRNCTIVSNSAGRFGGGVDNGLLTNCIVYFNTAPSEPNYRDSGHFALSFCCTTPLYEKVGITNTPLFIDLADGNLRPQSNSPCINAGNNAFVAGTTDLDGNPRISGGTVDIGAYEFQSPASVLSYAWAQRNGLPTDGSADFTDGDGDGANNWQEWRADTVPTNSASIFRMVTVKNGVSIQGTGLVVKWASVGTRRYWLERATNLGAGLPFQLIATNIPGASERLGVGSTNSFNDTTATNGGPYFYRVGVQ